MVSTVIGRDPELGELSSFLDRMRAGATAALVHGEAGAGKTTLWRATVQEAVARGYGVLATSPAAAEAMLSFAGLGDLLHDCLDEALPHVPPAQARALETALGSIPRPRYAVLPTYVGSERGPFVPHGVSSVGSPGPARG